VLATAAPSTTAPAPADAFDDELDEERAARVAREAAAAAAAAEAAAAAVAAEAAAAAAAAEAARLAPVPVAPGVKPRLFVIETGGGYEVLDAEHVEHWLATCAPHEVTGEQCPALMDCT